MTQMLITSVGKMMHVGNKLSWEIHIRYTVYGKPSIAVFTLRV